MKYFRIANFISWVGKNRQFYFFVGKGKTRVGGSVNHGIKNSSPKRFILYHTDKHSRKFDERVQYSFGEREMCAAVTGSLLVENNYRCSPGKY